MYAPEESTSVAHQGESPSMVVHVVCFRPPKMNGKTQLPQLPSKLLAWTRFSAMREIIREKIMIVQLSSVQCEDESDPGDKKQTTSNQT